MNIQFTPTGWAEFQELLSLDRKLFIRTTELIDAISRDPFKGIGKPEALRHHLSGCWSRRINDRHRLVYKVESDAVVILNCLFHYGE